MKEVVKVDVSKLEKYLEIKINRLETKLQYDATPCQIYYTIILSKLSRHPFDDPRRPTDLESIISWVHERTKTEAIYVGMNEQELTESILYLYDLIFIDIWDFLTEGWWFSPDGEARYQRLVEAFVIVLVFGALAGYVSGNIIGGALGALTGAITELLFTKIESKELSKIADKYDAMNIAIIYELTRSELTCKELAARLQLNPSIVYKRLKNLVEDDVVIRNKTMRPYRFRTNYNRENLIKRIKRKFL